ncbi:MAG: hypothetical protein WC655_11355 [Candidatus Hydrogenedentales bacterium]|jgi:hypothetical protein
MKWMKSIVWISVVCAFVGLTAAGAWAQGNASSPVAAETSADTPAPNAGSNYVDADSDGVCDNKGTASCAKGNKRGKGCDANKECPNRVDANGDGVCDNKGQGCGANKECPNRVDANGDGVCDNKGQGCGAKGRGRGQGGSGNGACQRNQQSGGRG